MTPGRAAYSGTDAPTRPGTRSGSARSVSGVCPEASRRPAGMRVAPASAGRDPCERRAFPSHFAVTSLTLAGRSLGCPALFGERDHVSAAARPPACAGRRRLLAPSPDGSRRQQFEFRASARMAASGAGIGAALTRTRACDGALGVLYGMIEGAALTMKPERCGRIPHCAWVRFKAVPAMTEPARRHFLHHARRDVPDALPFVAHRALLKSAHRPPRAAAGVTVARSPDGEGG